MGLTMAPPWQPVNNLAGVTKQQKQHDENKAKYGILLVETHGIVQEQMTFYILSLFI